MEVILGDGGEDISRSIKVHTTIRNTLQKNPSPICDLKIAGDCHLDNFPIKYDTGTE